MFEYLKDFNHDAYVFACDINREVTYSPGAVKAHSTSLLENIVNDMLERSGNRIANPRVKFHMKVQKLYDFEVISYKFKTQLLNTYKLRSSIHDDLAKTKEREFDIALKIHRALFDILWKYFEEFSEDEIYFGKPDYVEPVIDMDVEIDESSQSLPEQIPERLFDRCIICGCPNNSRDSNFCRDCNNKLDNVEDLINMRNSLVDLSSFTTKDIRQLGYSREYSRQLIIELLNENLIYKKDKTYALKENEFESFLNCINEYFEVNSLLTEFVLGKFKPNQIKNTEVYKKGLENVRPYAQVPKIVNEIIFKEFLEQVNLKIPIDRIMDYTGVTQEDIDYWFSIQMDDFKAKRSGQEFINYCSILMDRYLELKRKAEKNAEILAKLHISQEVVDFWKTSLKRQSQSFFNELREIEMDLVIDAISEGKTKMEACEIADISAEELGWMIEKGKNGDEGYEAFYNVFNDIYFRKRRENFLKLLSSNDYADAIEAAGLERKEVDMWYSRSEKDFAFGIRDANSFYVRTTKILLDNYINSRKLKRSKEESCRMLQKTIYDVRRCLNEEMFSEFKDKLDRTIVSLIIEGLKDNKSVEQISNDYDIPQGQIWKYIELGKEGDIRYAGIYNEYVDSYILNQLDEFLVQIHDKPKHKVLKAISLTEEEFDKYYWLGRSGNMKFKSFADEYHDFKIAKYINSIIKGRNQSKALRNADLTKDELDYDIEDKILERQMIIVLEEIAKDRTTKQAAKKANVTVDAVYDWFMKGRNGDEKFKDFADYYYEEYVEKGSTAVQKALEEGIPERFIIRRSKEHFTREDYDFWRKNNFLKKDYEINMDDKEKRDEKLKEEILKGD